MSKLPNQITWCNSRSKFSTEWIREIRMLLNYLPAGMSNTHAGVMSSVLNQIRADYSSWCRRGNNKLVPDNTSRNPEFARNATSMANRIVSMRVHINCAKKVTRLRIPTSALFVNFECREKHNTQQLLKRAKGQHRLRRAKLLQNSGNGFRGTALSHTCESQVS